MDYLRLSDCSDFVSDRTSNITFDNYISTENMIANRGGITTASSLPNAKTTSAYKTNDILLSNIRPYFCKIWLANKEGSCSNDVLVIRAKKEVNPQFLYYVLSDKNFFNWDNVTSKGTKMPRGTPKAIMKYFVPNVDESLQQKIANILSRYDEAIENNNKRIKLLEQMAQNLYKEWFVRFRFPGWQNAEFENGIPKGWEVKKVGDLYDTTSGGTPSREHEEYYQDGVYPWIKTGELKDYPILETEEKITEEALKHSSAKLFKKNSLIIAMYGATIGQLGINKMDATCNQACCVLRPIIDKAFGIYHLYNYFQVNRDFIIGLGNGAAQQNLSQDLIKKLKILNPQKNILKAFEEKETLLFDQIFILQKKNQNLAKQRDLLLPRLMSGKLEVK